MAALVAAVPAYASTWREREVIRNGSHRLSMPASRANNITYRMLYRNYWVRRSTIITACSRHSRRESGCDFAFTDKWGDYNCGNAVVKVRNRRWVIVRHVNADSGCSDF